MVLAGCVRVCPFVCLFVELGEVELLTMGDTRTVGFTLSLALISLVDEGAAWDIGCTGWDTGLLRTKCDMLETGALEEEAGNADEELVEEEEGMEEEALNEEEEAEKAG